MDNKPVILTAGCSFTKYKWQCWPNFVKWFEPSSQIINLGKPASCNEAIARSVINGVKKYKNVKKVFIMWSAPDRYQIVVDKKPETKSNDATTSLWNMDFNWHEYFGGHVDSKQHKIYQKHFLNEQQNQIRMLERIIFLQLYLEKHNIDYKMMCFKGNVIDHAPKSKGQAALWKQINWRKFIFYNKLKGFNEYAEENFPDDFFKPEDQHPHPIAHYYWVKDIMYKSNTMAPTLELDQLIKFKRIWKK
jgi:hypothetical protein